MMNEEPAQRAFPPTPWTQIRRAVAPTSEQALSALDGLLRLYLPAMRAHLIHLKRMSPDQAEDLIQGFVADKVLEGELLARADRERGTFRSFLLTTFDRYIISVFRREQAAKRAPEGGHIDIDEWADILAEPDHAEEAFDLEWVHLVIQESLSRVKTECENSGREAFWRLFQNRLVAPVLDGSEPTPYADLIEDLGFKSPLQASNALLTAKRMFQREFKAVVFDYTGSPE
ncbi:MAG: hypothetical protein AAF492_32535, partial [Verrucomicrobiota bacterium]